MEDSDPGVPIIDIAAERAARTNRARQVGRQTIVREVIHIADYRDDEPTQARSELIYVADLLYSNPDTIELADTLLQLDDQLRRRGMSDEEILQHILQIVKHDLPAAYDAISEHMSR